MAQMWNIVSDEPKHRILTSYPVDKENWHTIQCIKEVADWVRRQPNHSKEWYEHIDKIGAVYRTRFDVSNEFYLMLKLRWG